MSIINYALLLNHYMEKSLLKDVSPMYRKSFIKKIRETEPWGLSAVTAPLNIHVGKVWSSEDNYQAKEETPSGFGTPISPKSGVTLTIQYKGTDGSPIAKIFKISRERADAFIEELNSQVPFPTLETKGQKVTIPAANITEIRIEEEEDVSKVSKSKGKKATDMGSRKTTKST